MPAYEIVDGPGKFELMTSLFYAGPQQTHPKVVFKATRSADGDKTPRNSNPIVIIEITREDGNGERWCYVGVELNSGMYMKGYYDTRIRKGYYDYQKIQKVK